MAGFDVDNGLSLQVAREEAARCLFCFDAPCVAACPTGIDVPAFIHSIETGNLDGSARTILAANPMGGTCARVCPVESLCEGACVLGPVDRPIPIGALQRVAMDAYRDAGRPFFVPGPAAGKRVAIVGAGPAGLTCAAELRRQGIDVTIFEARAQAGGLCAYGIVPWRHAREMTAHEVAEVERAGVEIRRGTRVGDGPTAAEGGTATESPTADGARVGGAADGPTAARPAPPTAPRPPSCSRVTTPSSWGWAWGRAAGWGSPARASTA